MHDGDEVDEVLVARGRQALMSLEDGADLVGDVVDEWVGLPGLRGKARISMSVRGCTGSG